MVAAGTVSCVSPGPLDTPMSLALLGSEEAMQAARESWPIVPMNRLGLPTEIAGTYGLPGLRRRRLHHRPKNNRRRRHDVERLPSSRRTPVGEQPADQTGTTSIRRLLAAASAAMSSGSDVKI